MKNEKFPLCKKLKDVNNPFSDLFQLDEDSYFYVEPAFYTQLQGFEELRNDEYQSIINEMMRVVKKNHKVVFTGNFEEPQTDVEGFIYLEITDITDPLKIYVEDKSRGSDYGD